MFAQIAPAQVAALQRKKSLPDVQVPANAPAPITREEVSVLSSARREEIRRVEEENERLRANPLLYLVSPHMKVRAAVNRMQCVYVDMCRNPVSSHESSIPAVADRIDKRKCEFEIGKSIKYCVYTCI